MFGKMGNKKEKKKGIASNEMAVFEKSSYLCIFCINCHITILV